MSLVIEVMVDSGGGVGNGEIIVEIGERRIEVEKLLQKWGT